MLADATDPAAFGRDTSGLIIMMRCDFKVLDGAGGEVEGGDAAGVGAVDSAGVDDEGVADPFQTAFVGVAMNHHLVFATVDGGVQPEGVVPVQESDPDFVEGDLAEPLAAGHVVLGNCPGQRRGVVVDIAEDKRGWHPVKQRNNRSRADVTRVQNGINPLLDEDLESGDGEGDMSVRIADESDFHDSLLM